MSSRVASVYRNLKIKRLYRRIKKLTRRVRAINAYKKALYPSKNELTAPVFGKTWAEADPNQKLARRAFRYRGEGDYRDWLRYGSRGLGALAGGAMGYMSGGYTGASQGLSSGWGKGAQFSKFMGWGDYSTNQIIAGGDSNQQQISVNQGDLTGDVYIARTEFVRNVVVTGTAGGTSAFQVTSFALNPGLQSTFPWLSQVANCFTLYEFQGLIFQYKPLFSEDAGTSNTLGKVILATEYDPSAPDFLTSVQMENYDYCNSAKPSCGIVHGVETANSQQALNLQYIRTGTTTRDLIFTDIGKFQLATEGIPLPAAATSVIVGELWVTYKVKLSRAEIYSSLLGNNIGLDILRGTTSAAALTTGTTFTKSTNTIGVTVTPSTATQFFILFPVTLNLGYFQVQVIFNSGATVFTTQLFNQCANLVNCQFYTPGETLVGSTANGLAAPLGAYTGTTSNTGISITQWIYVNSPGLTQASFTVNVSAALTATTTWKVIVTQSPQLASVALT